MKTTPLRDASRPSGLFPCSFLVLWMLAPAAVLAAETQATPPASGAEDASLVPPWEPQQMGEHSASPVGIRFRPGKGLEVSSEDGAFSVTTRLRAQILYTLESAEGSAQQPDVTEGLQIRRARLAFQGHMFGKHNKFKLELAMSPRDMGAKSGAFAQSPILDWNLTFDHLPYATVVAGQYKVPYNRQRMVSSGSQQFVDRSIVQSEFNLDRDIGVDVRAKEPLLGLFRYYVGAYIGEGRGAYQLSSPGHMYLGRFEVLPFGKFEDYVESDFERSPRPRLSLGVAYSYLENAKKNAGILGASPVDGGTTDFHNAEADFIFKLSGLSIQGEAFWRQGRRRPGTAKDASGILIEPESPRDGYGFFTQAGYLIPRTALEFGARYGQLRPSGSESSLSPRNELGAVVGYYFAHHSLKFQADYFRLWGADGFRAGDNLVRLQMEAGF